MGRGAEEGGDGLWKWSSRQVGGEGGGVDLLTEGGGNKKKTGCFIFRDWAFGVNGLEGVVDWVLLIRVDWDFWGVITRVRMVCNLDKPKDQLYHF